MSRTPSQNPNLHTSKLTNLEPEVAAFLAKPPDAKMTVRDYALLIELWQVCDDMLGALEDMPLDLHPQVKVSVDGDTIKFENIEEVAEWLAPFME